MCGGLGIYGHFGQVDFPASLAVGVVAGTVVFGRLGFCDSFEGGAADGPKGFEAIGADWVSDRCTLGLLLRRDQIVERLGGGGNHGDDFVFFGLDRALVVGTAGQMV